MTFVNNRLLVKMVSETKVRHGGKNTLEMDIVFFTFRHPCSILTTMFPIGYYGFIFFCDGIKLTGNLKMEIKTLYWRVLG